MAADPYMRGIMFADAVAEAANTLALLAASRILSKWEAEAGAEAVRTALLSGLKESLDIADLNKPAVDGNDLTRFFRSAKALEEAISAAPVGSNAGFTLEAQKCLAGLGLPEPPGGWDEFEGPPEDDSDSGL